MSRTLFILPREKERAAIDKATQDEGLRKLMYRMVDAVWNVRDNEKVTEADLLPIWNGLLAAEEVVWRRAGGWLAKLVDFAPELTPVVDELATHRDDNVRYRVCAALTDRHFSDALIWPRLKRFLADRNGEVRNMAVSVCIERQNPRMIPALEAALTAETDTERRKRVQMAISLIKGEAFWLSEEK